MAAASLAVLYHNKLAESAPNEFFSTLLGKPNARAAIQSYG